MADLIIQPSTRLLKATYVLAALIAVGVLAWWYGVTPRADWKLGALVAPAWLAGAAAVGHTKRRFTSLTLAGDRLKYAAGVAAKTTRSFPIAKVQDVTVSQTLGQRILGLGNLSIETAGEASRLTIEEIDSPRVVAEKILDKVAEFGDRKGKRA